MRKIQASLFACVCLMLGGCFSGNPGHWVIGPAEYPEADTSDVPIRCVEKVGWTTSFFNSIERHGNRYWLGFLEVDDQGWQYDFAGKTTQLDVFERTLEAELGSNTETDFLVVTFIHGWRHDSSDDDCNVVQFRKILDTLNWSLNSLNSKRGTRVVGLYVGWFGQSFVRSAGFLDVLSFYARQSSAERVARGEVRRAFSGLHRIREQWTTPERRVRTLVVGHSFGGLIAFDALSQGILDSVILEQGQEPRCMESVRQPSLTSPRRPDGARFPDQLVLINPAFPGSRFEPFAKTNQNEANCSIPILKSPRVIIISADNDNAIGTLFRNASEFSGRLTGSFFHHPNLTEASHAREIEAAERGVGKIERYQTHRFCLKAKPDGGYRVAVTRLRPSDLANAQPNNLPFWIATVPPTIVDGHNNFFYARPVPGTTPVPYLLDWIIEETRDPSGSLSEPAMTDEQCLENGPE